MTTDVIGGSARAEWRANWPVVAAALAGVSLSSVPAASLGVMMVPIEGDLGWSRTEISLGTSLVSLVAMLLATLAGVCVDRGGARSVALAATILMCGGVALLSTVESHVWYWWGLWCVVGVAAAAMPTVWIVPISNLFSSGRGLAVAIALSGSGISTSLVPIIANSLVAAYGWRVAYLGLGAIWLAVVLPLVLLCFHGGDRRHPDGPVPSRPAARENASLPGLTARDGFRSPSFYKLAIAAFLSMSAGVAIILNLVPILRSIGLTAGTAAGIAGIIGIATIVGRIIGGWLMDRFSAALIAAISAGGAAILPLLLLLFPGSVPAAALGVAIYGLLGGAKVPAVVYLASKHFGQRAFGTLYGAINTMIALGVGLGPVMANLVYDIVRSYVPVMWTAIPFVLVAAGLYSTLGRYPDFELRKVEDRA